MLLKTRGLVLKITNYAETSVIAQIYTEEFGLQGYLIQGAKKPKAKIHVNILQSLHILDLIVYHKNTNGLQRIKEARQSPPFQDIPLNIVKSSLIIFLNEVLYKILRHQNHDALLFDFLTKSIIWLDTTNQKVNNFHIVFLIRLSAFLGLFPHITNKSNLDLLEGTFVSNIPQHTNYIAEPYTTIFKQMMYTNYDDMANIIISKADRKYLLEKLLDFYRLHIDNFGEINSLVILEEIFS